MSKQFSMSSDAFLDGMRELVSVVEKFRYVGAPASAYEALERAITALAKHGPSHAGISCMKAMEESIRTLQTVARHARLREGSDREELPPAGAPAAPARPARAPRPSSPRASAPPAPSRATPPPKVVRFTTPESINRETLFAAARETGLGFMRKDPPRGESFVKVFLSSLGLPTDATGRLEPWVVKRLMHLLRTGEVIVVRIDLGGLIRSDIVKASVIEDQGQMFHAIQCPAAAAIAPAHDQ